MTNNNRIGFSIYGNLLYGIMQVVKTFFKVDEIKEVQGNSDIPPHAILNMNKTLLDKVGSITNKSYTSDNKGIIEAITDIQKIKYELPVTVVIPPDYRLPHLSVEGIKEIPIKEMPKQEYNLILLHEMLHTIISYHPMLLYSETETEEKIDKNATIKEFRKEFGEDILKILKDHWHNIILDYTIDSISGPLINSISHEYPLMDLFNQGGSIYRIHGDLLYASNLKTVLERPHVNLTQKDMLQNPQMSLIKQAVENSYDIIKKIFPNIFYLYDNKKFDKILPGELLDTQFYSMFIRKNVLSLGTPFINPNGRNIFEKVVNNPIEAAYNFFLSISILSTLYTEMLYMEPQYFNRTPQESTEYWNKYIDHFTDMLIKHSDREQKTLIKNLANIEKSIINDVANIRIQWEKVEQEFSELSNNNMLFTFLRFFAIYGRSVAEASSLNLKLNSAGFNGESLAQIVIHRYEKIMNLYKSVLEKYASASLIFKKYINKNPDQQPSSMPNKKDDKKIIINITFPSSAQGSGKSCPRQQGNIQTEQNVTPAMQKQQQIQQGNSQEEDKRNGIQQKQQSSENSENSGKQDIKQQDSGQGGNAQKGSSKNNGKNKNGKNSAGSDKEGNNKENSNTSQSGKDKQQSEQNNGQGANKQKDNNKKDGTVQIEITIDKNGKIKAINIKNKSQTSGGLKVRMPDGTTIDINGNSEEAKAIREALKKAAKQSVGKGGGRSSGRGEGDGIGEGIGRWTSPVLYESVSTDDFKKILSWLKSYINRDSTLKAILGIAKERGFTGISSKFGSAGELIMPKVIKAIPSIMGGADSRTFNMYKQWQAKNIQPFNIVLILDVSGSMSTPNSVVSPFVKALYFTLNNWAKSITALVFSNSWRDITKDFASKPMEYFPTDIEGEGGTDPFNHQDINKIAMFLNETIGKHKGKTIVIFLSDGEFYMNIKGRQNGYDLPLHQYESNIKNIIAHLIKTPYNDIHIIAPRIGREISLNKNTWEQDLMSFIMRGIRKAIISSAGRISTDIAREL